MPMVSQTLTFLKGYFGDVLGLFLALFSRGGVKVDDVERASSDIDSDVDTDMKSAEGHDIVTPAPVPEVESTPTEPEQDQRTGPELLRAAVAASLSALPSLPSILKTPEARPPSATAPSSDSERQDFGTPSNLFYEHRLPFGNVTNLPRFGGQQKGMRLDNLEVKPLAPRKGKSKSRAKKSRPVQIPLIVVVDTDAVSAAQSLKSDPACGIVNVFEPVAAPIESAVAPVIVLESLPAPASILKLVPAPASILKAVPAPAPAPGSTDWDRSKAAALAQAQTFSDHLKASRRISLPAPAPIPVPAPVSVLVPPPPKRHSAPPVLGTPRKSIQDRLSALLAATTDTIAALDKDSEKIDQSKKGEMRIKNGGVPEIGEVIKEARRCSALALEEGREVFTVGEDSDDEDDEEDDEDDIPLSQLIPIGKARQDPPVSILPTVDPASPPRLISSISASADLVNASSRSLNELFNAYDQAIDSPRWRRLLARSDDIDRRRRNDSIV